MFHAWKSGAIVTFLILFFFSGQTPASEKDQIFPARWVLAADDSAKRVALLDSNGTVLWQRAVENLHDLHLLPDGHVLMQDSWTHIIEIIPGIAEGNSDQIVWQYDSGKMNGNAGKPVQVHSFQRLADGTTMIAESGIARIIEVDRDGKITHQIKLKVEHPNTHRDTRLVHKLDNGHYLIAHEGDGVVREYDADGSVIWEYAVPLFDKQPAPGHGPESFGNCVFSAIRLASGNTLMSTGNGHSLLEVTPDKKIIWKLTQNELLGIQLAWVTTLRLLPNGNIIFGNCHAGPANPQIIEITRDKKVVWTFKDWTNFKDALTSSVILDANEKFGVQLVR